MSFWKWGVLGAAAGLMVALSVIVVHLAIPGPDLSNLPAQKEQSGLVMLPVAEEGDTRDLPSVEIITAYLALDHFDKAKSFIDQEKDKAVRGRILSAVLKRYMFILKSYWVGDDSSPRGWKADPRARKAVEFVASMAPVNDPESDYFLAILLARAYKEYGEMEEATRWLDVAVEARRITTARVKSASTTSAKSVQKSTAAKGRTAPEKVSGGGLSLGGSIVLSAILGAIGFVLAVILKPGLEAYGKCVVGRAIAEITKNPEILRHLSPKDTDVPEKQPTDNPEKSGLASIQGKYGHPQEEHPTSVT